MLRWGAVASAWGAGGVSAQRRQEWVLSDLLFGWK